MDTTAAQVSDAEVIYAYLRVSTQGPNRYQTSSFLAGITFAAFAALVSTKPLEFVSLNDMASQCVGRHGTGCANLHIWEWLQRNGDTLKLAVTFFSLGAATVLLLLTTLGAYRAMLILGDVPGKQGKALEEGTIPAGIDNFRDKIISAYKWYHKAGHLIPWPVGLILLSVVSTSFYLSVYLGFAALATLLGSAIYLPQFDRILVRPIPTEEERTTNRSPATSTEIKGEHDGLSAQ